MAAYPTLPTTLNSKVTPLDGKVSDRATNGALKQRRLFTSDKLEWTLEHEIGTTDKTTLETFWGTNKDLDITYTSFHDGASYTVRMRKPAYRPVGLHWFADVTLEEV